MKRIIYLICMILLYSIQTIHAQYVSIPDSNFRAYLLGRFPTAMLGNNLDTTNTQVINATVVDVDSLHITSIDGIQYFDNLQTLNCGRNYIATLPMFPNALTNLICKQNVLTQLPDLPSTLVDLNCSSNQITQLPILPNGLVNVDCSGNKIDTLQPYTPNIVTFNCSGNLLTSIPSFTNTILNFNCSYNQITSIPVLSSFIQLLNTSGNTINVLPTLTNNLQTLSCYSNGLSVLPALPSSLVSLECAGNLLTQLPTLPSSLTYLETSTNQLTSLPTLPSNLMTLHCYNNQLPLLPSLPSTLSSLYCGNNLIPSLPALPNGLIDLDYSSNPISALPTLPSTLQKLIWNSNLTTQVLPTLPNSLKHLEVNNTPLSNLPILSTSLNYLACSNDGLTSLPTLPNTLLELYCQHDSLVSLPSLPTSLRLLSCDNNHLTALPTLPTTLYSLSCGNNTNLMCLPKLPPTMELLYIGGTAIVCLPNRFMYAKYSYQDPFILNLPLCDPSSNCEVAWNIAGNVHIDTSLNCMDDSLNPGQRLSNVKMVLINASNSQDSMVVTGNGEYSFDTYANGNYSVYLDTLEIPVSVLCPSNGIQNVTLSGIDTLKPNINFGVKCNEIDAGVKTIIGRFRPAVLSHVNIKAGDLAQYYNLSCGISNISATVTTVLSGPVSFVQATANSVIPNSVSGNVITYFIPDITIVDFNTAFNIDVITDVSANIGNSVCITTTISNITNEQNTTNNSLHICFDVVNSFDPNEKTVTPKDDSEPGDELIYTVYFQNTGSDTAYKVVVLDTLSSNLDWNTFEFMNASHEVVVRRNADIVNFTFNDINLLDSVHNEPQSHGWLQFKIKLKNNLAWGTKTVNLASIYFDYNSAIVTNEAVNFIGSDTTYLTTKHPVILPTAFTPNSDDLNDTWHILNTTYLQRKKVRVDRIVVTNRWGQTVFMGNDMNFVWKPTQGTAADNYFYTISYTYELSGNQVVEYGNVVIIR
jgi:gliding motility-associated-like protein/uncharacterized repeat protein (TIGR01451 family)